MEISKTSLNQFRIDLASSIRKLEEDYGVRINIGSIKYSDNDFRTKMTVTNVGKDTSKSNKEIMMEHDFKTNAYSFGLSKEDLGRKFLSNGKTYTIVGSKARSYKYPILATNGEKIFKFNKNRVKNNLI